MEEVFMMSQVMDLKNKNPADRSTSPAIPKDEATEPCEVAHIDASEPFGATSKPLDVEDAAVCNLANDNSAVEERPIPMELTKSAESKEEIEVENTKSKVETEVDNKKLTEMTEDGQESGVIVTEAMEAEEEALHQKTVAQEEEQIKRHQQEFSSLDDRIREQRYKRLEFLLSKSNMYTTYLVTRMQQQQAAEKKKQEKHLKKQAKDEENDGDVDEAVVESNNDTKSDLQSPKGNNETSREAAASQKSPAASRRSSRKAAAVVEPSKSPTPAKSGRGRRKTKALEDNDGSQSSQDSQASVSKRGRKRKASAVENYKISDYLSEAMSRTKKQKMDDNSESHPESTTGKQILDSSKDVKGISKDSGNEENVQPENLLQPVRIINGEHVSPDQPTLLTGGVLRSYQVEGFLWLKVLYENGVNGILADEMGLGKTIQCIASIAYLVEQGVPGPFLVCGPLSTVPNWVAEFERFAPQVPVILYHGSIDERAKLRRKIRKTQPVPGKNGIGEIHPVIITSYEIIMNDRAHLQNYHWKYIIVDEGHRIKNFQCRLIRELKLYSSTHRLLLTGTPLQNNLAELWSLLNFLLPEIFDDLTSFEMWFDVSTLDTDEAQEKLVVEEQRNNILNMLHQILQPFMLRRLKSDVDLVIPPKRELLVYAPLTPYQQDYYTKAVDKTILKYVDDQRKERTAISEEVVYEKGRPARRASRGINYTTMLDMDDNDVELDMDDGEVEKWFESLAKEYKKNEKVCAKEIKAIPEMECNIKIRNIMMLLRRVCNHPYLLEYPLTAAGEYKINEDLVKLCGKTLLLDRMLPELKKRGHKVLIFSQMTTMLDILQDYCYLRKYGYCRLDGSMGFQDRRSQIDSFNKDPSMFIFLLSTRAGGLGINLTAADTVIIYDSDWNPQSDLQAQDRCHRIGQTRPVVVYRFVTANTIDQKIVERASAKRKLEKMVIHKGKFKQGLNNFKDQENARVAPLTPKELLELLKSRDWESEHGAGKDVISKDDLERLLDRSDLYQLWEEKKDVKKSGEQPSKSSKNGSGKKDIQGVFKVVSQATGFESNIMEELH